MCSHSAKLWAKPIQSAASCSISTARAAKPSRSSKRTRRSKVDRAVPCSMLDLGGAAAIVLVSPGGAVDPPQRLGLSASHNHQHNPADHTKSAQDRWEINTVFFLMLDFNRAELRILFLSGPAQPTVSKPDDADDN